MKIRRSLAAASTLLLLSAGTALAWTPPVLVAECAPDDQHFAWTIGLSKADDQDLELSWSADFALVERVSFPGVGTFPMTTLRGGPTLYVRYRADHSTRTSAAANEEPCAQPSPTPSPTPTSSPTPAPTPTPTLPSTESIGPPAGESGPAGLFRIWLFSEAFVIAGFALLVRRGRRSLERSVGPGRP